MSRRNLLIGVSIIVFVAILGWLFTASTKPMSGQQISDLGREHVTDISNITYNSNPPTSGTHFPIWAKRGVYDRVLSDGHLIHSLEHGYIVASYNCELGQASEATSSAKPLTQMKVAVSGEMSAFTPQNPPEKEIELSANFASDDCQKLVSELSTFLNDYQRYIVVPRPGMDNRIALTAWTRLLTMDNVDKEKIKQFVEAYHNLGPERTIE